MSDYDTVLRNAAQLDPEQPDVRFYPVSTGYTDALRKMPEAVGGTTPAEYYASIISTWDRFGGSLPMDQYACSVIEGTWYNSLQPEYKAYPSIVCALAATKIEIGCEQLKMPFPAFAIRLPEGFVQEPGGPPIRCLFVAMMRNYGGGAVPVTSMDSDPMGDHIRELTDRIETRRFGAKPPPEPFKLPFPMGVWQGRMPNNTLMIQAKYIDKDGDDAFANFMIALDRDKTLEEEFEEWLLHSKDLDLDTRERLKADGIYFLSDQLARELLSLAVGVSFFATGRHKAARPILQREKRPRIERRRFEKEHDGEEQPTFTVGRELMLPREQGAPAPDGGREPGEGEGHSLKFAHMRCGHLRYQAHGPGLSERKLVFIEPTLVRPDLPLGGRVTPGGIVGGKPTHDVTERKL